MMYPAVTPDPTTSGTATPFGTHPTTGVFATREATAGAVRRLAQAGVPTNTIDVYLVDREEDRPIRRIRVRKQSGALEGAVIGAGVGALVGVVAVAGVASGVLGPTSADPFGLQTAAGAARGIAAAAAAGVPLGALLGMGYWSKRHIPAEEETRHRKLMVVVDSEACASTARRILRDSGARRVESAPGDRHDA